jgi:hypothetical protein
VVEITAAFDFNEAVSLEELMLVQHEGGESGHSITSDMMRMLLLEARCVCVQGRQGENQRIPGVQRFCSSFSK